MKHSKENMATLSHTHTQHNTTHNTTCFYFYMYTTNLVIRDANHKIEQKCKEIQNIKYKRKNYSSKQKLQ